MPDVKGEMSKKSKDDATRRTAPPLLDEVQTPKVKRDPLKKLNKAWQKASIAERAEFLAGLGIKRQDADATNQSDDRLIANGRYLLPATVVRIEQIMVRRNIRPDTVMTELGFDGEGPVLTRALAKGASLRLAVIASLRDWLAVDASR